MGTLVRAKYPQVKDHQRQAVGIHEQHQVQRTKQKLGPAQPPRYKVMGVARIRILLNNMLELLFESFTTIFSQHVTFRNSIA